MDWAKVLDKFYVFIVALVPGGSVAMVFVLHHLELWNRFWSPNYLGYETKIAVLAFSTFVAGLTVNEFVSFAISFAISFVGGYKAAQANTQQPQIIAYWRSENWRKLLIAYLGDAAPANVQFIDEAQLPNDTLWQEWWNHLYRLVTDFQKNREKDIGLNTEFSIGYACLVLLIAAPWTPALRLWWILAPSAFWVYVIVVFYFQRIRAAMNPDYWYSKQIDYLRMRVCKGEQSEDDEK